MLTSGKRSQRPGMWQRDDAWLDKGQRPQYAMYISILHRTTFPGQPGERKNKWSVRATDTYPSPRRKLPVHTTAGIDVALVVTKTRSALWGCVCYTRCRRFDHSERPRVVGTQRVVLVFESCWSSIRRRDTSNRSWSLPSVLLNVNVARVIRIDISTTRDKILSYFFLCWTKSSVALNVVCSLLDYQQNSVAKNRRKLLRFAAIEFVSVINSIMLLQLLQEMSCVLFVARESATATAAVLRHVQ